MRFVSFLGRHLFWSFLVAAGFVLTSLGYIDQGTNILRLAEGWQMQLGGWFVFAIGVVGMLYRWDGERRPVAISAGPVADPVKERRREIIEIARNLAHVYVQGGQQGSFAAFLETRRQFSEIRPYLDAEMLKSFDPPRTVYAMNNNAAWKPPVRKFLAEIERLEREWDLLLIPATPPIP